MDFSQTLHIAVDVQDQFVRRLSKERQETYQASVRSFADDLSVWGVETLWVASGAGIDVVAPLTQNKSTDMWKRAFSELLNYKVDCGLGHNKWVSPILGLPQLRDHEVLLVKFRNSAFEINKENIWVTERGAVQSGSPISDGLANYIKRHGYNHVLITGMHTSMCVSDTIKGALANKLTVSVVKDLLADSSPRLLEPKDYRGKEVVDYNVEKLLVKLAHQKHDVRLVIQNEVMMDLVAQPLPALAKPSPSLRGSLVAF